ncbi:calcium-binding protein [Tritonibacter horizontis]|uniref:Hemolysin, chromosomal n=1 Tax=Tritonibacter horizontis TaxID=1768241 RepID=A0A132BZU0_9RHOB|nr:calcium-binding protein [Tritonibacter horizontis]KUP93869.1 hemolysin, chromosomal [Tritonibacter horizontis]
MKTIFETATKDLSGFDLLPTDDELSAILSDPDYLVSELISGVEIQAYLQADRYRSFDYDTFVGKLDAGDTYQIRLEVDDTSHFTSNRAITIYEESGRYVDLVLNNHGDLFDDENAIWTDEFSAGSGGQFLFFTKIREASTPGAHNYSLELVKTVDVDPFSLVLAPTGNGGVATLSVGDQPVSANSRVQINVTFANPNMDLDDVSLSTSGSISSYQSSNGTNTTVSITASPASAVEMSDLLRFTFSGTDIAGSVEISSIRVSVNFETAPIEVSGTLTTPGNLTVQGTRRADELAGDIGDDTVSGRGGDDTISGHAGDDLLQGGARHDTLNGGTGNDTLMGNAGSDALFGQTGSDLMKGGGGRDTIYGASGRDVLVGNGGNDSLVGGSGNDTLSAGAGSDQLIGGAGRDRLAGGNGEDTLQGSGGSDFLDGGKGNDLLEGGGGRDRFEFNKKSGEDRIADFQDDIDTILLDTGLWRGDLRKSQVVEEFGSVIEDSILLDFGRDSLLIEGISDLSTLADDLKFI